MSDTQERPDMDFSVGALVRSLVNALQASEEREQRLRGLCAEWEYEVDDGTGNGKVIWTSREIFTVEVLKILDGGKP